MHMMKMNNWITLLATLVVACSIIALSGCDDDDSSPAPAVAQQPPAPQPTPPPAQPAPPPVTQPAPSPTVMPTMTEGRGSRVTAIRNAGRLVCGGRDNAPGFAFVDPSGTPSGFDVDLCKAIAVAVLGTPDAIQWNVMAFADREAIMMAGSIDVLTMQTTWTTLRDATWGDYAPIMFYSGQTFMLRRSMGVTSLDQLQNATICVAAGTTTESNLADFVAERPERSLSPMVFPDGASTTAAYVAGTCNVVTSDTSDLISTRVLLADPDMHVILPETISEEPLAPVVPHGDGLWADIVKTVMSILIYAEAYDVTQTTVPTAPTGDIKVDRLFGLSGDFGQASLGLQPTVAQDIIRAVGNYGEIYERTMGSGGLRMPRAGSRNALWADAPCQTCPKGGQLYAAPPQ